MGSDEAALLLSPVEKWILRRSGRQKAQYEGEAVPVLEVGSVPDLGRAVALRFIEWVCDHPGGVISLPTGRTPEHFIRQVRRLLTNWEASGSELREAGLDPTRKPSMRSLHFVQMDEFYPMDPTRANSFRAYVEEHYIRGFGLDPDKALLIDTWGVGCVGTNAGAVFGPGSVVDLSLRTREPRGPDEAQQAAAIRGVDAYCDAYEDAIRGLGGIGFWLGGLGPDGHVAFNCRGGSPYSTTRLCATNYETMAAAAPDLGGIVRGGKVVTIGLETISRNDDAVCLVFAAGDAKAGVVRDAAARSLGPEIPASALRRLLKARFVVTRSAASRLVQRRLEDLSEQDAERVGIDIALRLGKRLDDLRFEDWRDDTLGRALVRLDDGTAEKYSRDARNSLVAKIDHGLREADRTATAYLHTAPHHDDVVLAYLALASALFRDSSNHHTFAYATSGFNGVTNAHAARELRRAAEWLDSTLPPDAPGTLAPDGGARARELVFAPDDPEAADEDVDRVLDGRAAKDPRAEAVGAIRRTLRIVATVFGPDSDLGASCRDAAAYFETRPPGTRDRPEYQRLKGMLREFEADVVWGWHGFRPSEAVKHLRLGFYQGKRVFAQDPELGRDVRPICDLLDRRPPDVVTVALDPEGSGPDTHYKVLQAVTAACKIHFDGQRRRDNNDVRVWGYRNVWFSFHASEASLFFPVTPANHADLAACFETAFRTQRDAPFPAPEFDGPFSAWSQKIQHAQYAALTTLLGRAYFRHHPDARVRAARGFIFIADMSLDVFFHYARDIADATTTTARGGSTRKTTAVHDVLVLSRGS